MIWLAWRQLRTAALVTLGLLALLAAGLVAFGLVLRDAYDTDVASCAAAACGTALGDFRRTFTPPVTLLGILVMAVPALLGAFWGAPLVARELETGTHRLVWTQGVSRTRWLAVRLATVTLVGVAVTGAAGLLLAWATLPYDEHAASRFGAIAFASRNLTPFGYAAFAVVLGVAAGLLLRRTLPAMALTLALVAAVQIAVPFTLRPQLMPPVERSIAVTAESLTAVSGFGIHGGQPLPGGGWTGDAELAVDGYEVRGAWMLGGWSVLRTADGEPANPALGDACFEPAGPAASGACLAKQDLHFDVRYQPGDRYWPFQAIETAGYLALALLLAGFSLRRVPRVAA